MSSAKCLVGERSGFESAFFVVVGGAGYKLQVTSFRFRLSSGMIGWIGCRLFDSFDFL